jgi:ribosomal protein L37AE/L43A
VAKVQERHAYRIENFDPLLRDLVAWDLVVRADGDLGSSWLLTDAAQKRLGEIIRPESRVDNEDLVYLDHLCADCRFRGITRLHDGVYLCSTCLATRVVQEPDPVPTSRRWRWRRHRQETNGRDGRAASAV